MAANHQRFALQSVTYAGHAMPGATIDCWQDSRGGPWWSARIVTRSCPEIDHGELAGRTADGRVLSGQVRISDRQVGPGGRRETLVVFHGSGPLEGFDAGT